MSSFYQRGAEKRRTLQEMRLKEKEVGSCSTGPGSPKQGMEQEKRLRREIANSNERRRMQSINAGFQSLKTMIPHHEGEKLSKAAILQHTTDYICQLEHIRSQLVAENNELKQLVQQGLGNGQNTISPPPKRKKRDTESSDEGIGMTCTDAEDHGIEDYKRELMELRSQLEQERKHRLLLERRLLAVSNTRDHDLTMCKTEVPTQPWLKGGSDVEESQQVPRPTVSLSPPSPPLATTSSQPSPFLHSVNSSLSRRNLDTIVEAIRHLEGEHALVDGRESERSVPASCACIPHSEESGTESSYDQEDCLSENLSPRCDSQSSSVSSSSPSTSQMDCEISNTPASATFTASPTVHTAPHPSLLHQGTSLLSHGIPAIHCSPYTNSAAYPLPLQLLTHAAAVATAKPQQPHPSVAVMQKS